MGSGHEAKEMQDVEPEKKNFFGVTTPLHKKETQWFCETDPNGKDPHEAGAKLDEGKVRLGLVMTGFARALEEVGKVGTVGALKYSADGWLQVPDGEARYTDAMWRHWVKQARGEKFDKATGLAHASHLAWNALARLELMLRGEDHGQ